MIQPPPIIEPPPIIRATPRHAPVSRQHDSLAVLTAWLSGIACAAALVAAILAGVQEYRFQRAMAALDEFGQIFSGETRRESLEQEYRQALKDVREAWEAANRD